MSIEPLRQLGKYELQERLGQGGMAEVWKARDTQLQRYVAIKLLHANLQADPNFMTRFLHEAQVIASLRHPNIVQIHDFQVYRPSETDNPLAYMVMAYIEGQTLADYIAKTSARGNFPTPAEIVNLFTSISLAIDYAHQKGMIHRDIKPANILLDRHTTARNPMGEPILSDFGLAKLLGVTAGAVTASQPGTPLYTSPEQARGYAGNERSDLYSLGVILYEMVTGVPPFRGDSPTAVLAQHLQAAPPPPTLLNPNIPPALTMVIMTALAKDPNARFARAATLTAAIAEAMHVPIPESLGQPSYPPSLGSMPTYITPSSSQPGMAAPPTASTPSFASASPAVSPISGSSPSVTPASGGARSSGQMTPVPSQPYPAVSFPGGTTAGGASSPGISSPGTIPDSFTPLAPTHPAPVPPRPSQPRAGRRWRWWYTGLAILLLIVIVGAGLGAYFAFYRPPVQTPAAVPGGQAFFLSSGQFNVGSAQGIADELLIRLQHVPDPQPGKSYYAWLLGDLHPQVEKQPLQPPPLFTLPLLLGKVTVSQGNASFFYQGTANHDNLFSLSSRMLITQEDAQGTPRGPNAPRSAWVYYAEIPQTPYGSPALSALDHIRHLYYKETKVGVLGLPGGLDVWLFRNTEKVMEWATSARDDYHTQVTDPTVIHNLFVSILDYLDGAPNVHLDVPGGVVAADPVISRVALLSVSPIQQLKQDVANNPPGYLDHTALHLQGVVQAPDATPQMRTLANEIIQGLKNAKAWLEQVRVYARQLVLMDANQLTLPSTLTMLDNMLLYATYAYIGKLDPQTDQVLPGVLEAHYNIQRLATFALTPTLPQSI